MQIRHLSCASLLLIATSASAQVLPAGASVRAAPQITSYSFGDPKKTISQLAIPIAVEVPLFSRLALEVGTAFAKSKFTGGTSPSEISGLTDTQVRGNLSFGNDNVVFTAGVNLPTGQSTVKVAEVPAAGQIGSEFLAFPIPSMGSGLAATGGIAVARNFGAWNLGFGGAFRHATEFEPFQSPDTTPNVKYTPGSEMRARVGIDRTLGAEGTLSLGFTVSQFSDDKAATFTFNSGNRYVTQASYATRAGNAEVFLAAWDIIIGSGKALSGVTSSQNIMNASAAIGWALGKFTVEPNLEARYWTSGGDRLGLLTGGGLRVRVPAGSLVFYPAVGMNVGKLGGGTSDVSMSGYRASLTAHLR